LDAIFGRRLLSIHRAVATTLFVAALICIAYVVFEATRAATGKTFRWPFIKPHWETGFPWQVLPAMISISVTRLIVDGSIRVFGKFKWGTLAFLVAIGLAGYMSAAFAMLVAFAFEPILLAILSAVATAFHYITHFDEVGIEGQYQLFHFLPLLWARIMIGVSLAFVAIRDPFLAWWFFFGLAQHNDEGLVRAWYDFCISTGVGGIRVLFAVAFIGSWAFLPPLKWITSLIVLRLAEAERGALTAVGAALAVFAKLIQEYAKAPL